MRVRGARRWWGGGARRWWGAGGLLMAAVALLLRVPQHSHVAEDFPHISPHDLAHYLADFSNHPKLDPEIGSWSVEEEEGNYTWWRYSVRYECGAWCSGRARVQHAAGAAIALHGAAGDHDLRVLDLRCKRLPLLPWPWFCEETEVETRIEQAASGGSRLREAAHGTCGVLRALAGHCALRAHRRDVLAALEHAL